MKHYATYVNVSPEGEVVGLCACGWVENVPRHRYVYSDDGMARVSKSLQEHVAANQPVSAGSAGGEGR